MKSEVIKLYSIFSHVKYIQPFIYFHIFACENIFFQIIFHLISFCLVFDYFLYDKH